MVDRSRPVEAVAWPFIEQCRREIDAAWTEIEAARDVLRRSRWLRAKWAEQREMGYSRASTSPISSDRSEAARIGMFVIVEPQAHGYPRGGRRLGRVVNAIARDR
jgi:hypothetical protein